MAGRQYTPVNFGLEKNIVQLFAKVSFTTGSGSSQTVPFLDTSNSKGFCSINPYTPTFQGTVGSGSATITSVTSFFGLFPGMQVTGGTVTASGSFTIGTITPSTGSIVMSGANFVSAGSQSTFVATGGEYIVQLGTQAATRLDTYAKLLDFNYMWDESLGSASGQFGQGQSAPNAANIFILQNNTKIRTIPSTATSGSTDATIIFVMGNGVGGGFVPSNPVNGDTIRISLVMGNSTAP